MDFTRYNLNSTPTGQFRSKLEFIWSSWLDSLHIHYIYEPLVGQYKPDFYLPSLNLFLECKGGFYSEPDLKRAEEIRQISKMDQLLSIGVPSLDSPPDLLTADGMLSKALILLDSKNQPYVLSSQSAFLPGFGGRLTAKIKSIYELQVNY